MDSLQLKTNKVKRDLNDLSLFSVPNIIPRREQVKGHLAKFSVQIKHKQMQNRGIHFPSFIALSKKVEIKSLNIPGIFKKSL